MGDKNLYQNEYNAKLDEIVLLSSEDSHYSMPKGANVLNIDYYTVAVDEETREIKEKALETAILKAKANGKKYIIAVSNSLPSFASS